MRIVFDIETNGLLPEVDRIHVMSWYDLDQNCVHSTKDLDVMRTVMANATTIIGHNIICYDLPVLKKFAIETSADIIDTLPLSWYLEPSRARHGLEFWGNDLGVEKPEVDDWENLTYEDYRHRCEMDVRINKKLYEQLDAKLSRLYFKDDVGKSRIIDYLNFKMVCVRDQEAHGWKLNVTKAEQLAEQLSELKEEAERNLIAAMPAKPITKVVNPPKVMHKKDGSLSSRGEAWLETLRQNYLPASTKMPITVKVGDEPGNPNSTQQVKEWLEGLGWKPKTFKFVRDTDGDERRIPQVRDGQDLCESVTDLIEVEPSIKYLEDLTILTHRLGIVKGFLECVDAEGYLVAGVSGLTNTLRFKHRKPLVNLPGVDRPWGAEVRGCLVASEGNKLIGCDMVSLEDTTKRHYMQPLDPDYVAEMQQEGFDPHLDLAKHAGAITERDIEEYNNGKRPDIKSVRKSYKAANYACVYGVGATTLSRATGLGVTAASRLIKAYWDRNWAVQKVAEARKVRPVGKEKWMYNEVSGFWYSLRADKDRWSTTNQGTGVYVFDTFVRHLKAQGVNVVGQFHDEAVIDEWDTHTTFEALHKAIDLTNKQLNMNVPFLIDYEIGDNYAAIH